MIKCKGENGLPRWHSCKEPTYDTGDARDSGEIPGSARSRGEGNGNPHQYSCLENSMDRGAWRATVQVITKIQTWLNDWAHRLTYPMIQSLLFNWEKWKLLCPQLDLNKNGYGSVIKLRCLSVEQITGCGIAQTGKFSQNHLKRPWCWEILNVGREGDDRG